MGAVYQAHDTLLDRCIALKVIRFPGDRSAQVVQRFYREARIAAGFTHPHLCPVHDLGDVGIHEVPEGSYATVAGLVLDHLNHLPDVPGDRVVVGEWELEVTGVGPRSITEVTARPVDG